MSVALSLAPRLTLHRLRGSHGGATLDVLALIAFTVSAFLTLTVAGGTWMFVQRWQRPSEQMLSALGLRGVDAVVADSQLQTYVILAVVACALLVVPVLNLGAAAARLGARGRAQRLASLRLIGMSGRQVVTMSVVETTVQATVAFFLALAAWLVSLPAWALVRFQGQNIGARELLMPWWLVVTLALACLAMAAGSTVAGLRQVRISPLGVATQQTPPALRAWRLWVFIAAVITAVVFGQLFGGSVMTLELQVYAIAVAMILFAVSAVNLVGPWGLQLLARPAARTRSPARLVAMRRIIDDPRGAWRNVSGVALLGTVSAFVAMLPTDPEFLGADPGSLALIKDLRTGVIITLAVGLLVAAVSTLISQAALVLDRANETIAMDRAGFPTALFAAIRRTTIMMPMVLTLTISIGIGLLLTVPFLTIFSFQISGILLVLATAAAGTLLTLGAAEACRPLQRSVLTHTQRRND